VPAFTRRTVCRLARRPVGAALEARIPAPTAPAGRNHLPLAILGEVADKLTGIDVMHDGSARYVHVKIVARTPGLVPARTTLTAFGPEFPGNTEVREGIHGSIRDQVNAAATAAITTVRAASFDVLFTAEAEAAVAAIAGLHANGCFVDELHSGIVAP
jgi:hypothetical protein